MACARIGPLPPILVRRGTISIFRFRPEAERILSEKALSVVSLAYSVDDRRSETACRIVSTKPSNPATTGGNLSCFTAHKSLREESHDCSVPVGTMLFVAVMRRPRYWLLPA